MDNVKKWVKDVLTGSNNRTLAIGRVLGVVLLLGAIFTPVIEVFTLLKKEVSLDQWGIMLAQWQVYLPILTATAGGIIAGTAFTEPKDHHDDSQE